MINTILFDDLQEIDYLKEKLIQFSNIRIVGETNNICQAVTLIQEKSPNLLFLNIDSGGKSGFHLIDILKTRHIKMPFLIFTTTYNEFILQALRSGAVDYLLKPINEAELQNAIERAIAKINKDNHEYKVDRLIDYISTYKQLFFPTPTGYKSVNIRDIIYIYRNPDNTKVKVVLGEFGELELSSSYSLIELMNILPRFDFFKIKRDVIVNLRYLDEVESHTKICRLRKGNFKVDLEISKRSLKEFKDRVVI